MTDIETETERWEGQVSDEWRRDTIYWLRATPNEDIKQYIDNLRHNSERRSQARFDTQTADKIADELEELIEDD